MQKRLMGIAMIVAPLLMNACMLFGQPNDKPLATISTVFNDHILTVNAPNTGLVAAAIAIRGSALAVKTRDGATNCFSSLAHDLIYCKFGDLTPYSNTTVTYTGNTQSAVLAWDDGQDIAPTFSIPF